jgi:Protein of unknown function (DUF1343)
LTGHPRKQGTSSPAFKYSSTAAVQQLYPKQYEVDKETEQLINKVTLELLLAGKDPLSIAAGWRDSIDQFEQVRQKYLIYRWH